MAWTLTTVGGQYKDSPFYMEFLIDSEADLANECTQYGIPAAGSLATIPGGDTYMKTNESTWVLVEENASGTDDSVNAKLAAIDNAEYYGDGDYGYAPGENNYKDFVIDNNLLDTSVVKDIGALVEPNSTKYYTVFNDAITDVIAGTYTHATSTATGAICSIHVNANVRAIKLLADCTWSPTAASVTGLNCIFDLNGHSFLQDAGNYTEVSNSSTVFYGAKEDSCFGYGNPNSTKFQYFTNTNLFIAIGIKNFSTFESSYLNVPISVYGVRDLILKDIDYSWESQEGSTTYHPLFLGNGLSTANTKSSFKFINVNAYVKAYAASQGAIFHIKQMQYPTRIEFKNCNLKYDSINKQDTHFSYSTCIRMDVTNTPRTSFNENVRLIVNDCNFECTNGPVFYGWLTSYFNNCTLIGGKSVISLGNFFGSAPAEATSKFFFKNCKIIEKDTYGIFTSAKIINYETSVATTKLPHWWIYMDNVSIEGEDCCTFTLEEANNRLYMSNCNCAIAPTAATGSLIFMGANMDSDMKEDNIDTGNDSYSYELYKPTLKVGMTELTEAQLIALLALLN